MASYTTPPVSQGGQGPNGNSSNRINPLAPVAYKPTSSYVPSAPKKDRMQSIRRPDPNSSSRQQAANGAFAEDHGLPHTLNGSSLYPLPPIQHQHPSPLQQEYQSSAFQPSPQLQSYQPQYAHASPGAAVGSSAAARRSTDQLSSVGSISSVSSRDSVLYRTPTQQQSHQPSSGYKLAQVSEEEGEPRSSFQSNYRQDMNLSNQDLQNDVSSLNIASPPRQRQQDQSSLGYQQQQQQQQPYTLPPTGSYTPNAQPYQPYQSHEHLPQLQQPQYPFAEGHGYPQQSPSASSVSQLYRTSTGSSTVQTAWSQPSSPGFPPSPYTAHQGAIHENGDLDSQDSGSLSEAARLLIDFNAGILSTIAVAFREKMLQNESKRLESANYGLEFPVTFTGKEAVVGGTAHFPQSRHTPFFFFFFATDHSRLRRFLFVDVGRDCGVDQARR